MAIAHRSYLDLGGPQIPLGEDDYNHCSTLDYLNLATAVKRQGQVPETAFSTASSDSLQLEALLAAHVSTVAFSRLQSRYQNI